MEIDNTIKEIKCQNKMIASKIEINGFIRIKTDRNRPKQGTPTSTVNGISLFFKEIF